MFQSKHHPSFVLALLLVFSILMASLPASVAAWDSLVPTANSHYLWAGAAIDELRTESSVFNELDREEIVWGAQSEVAHPQRRNLTDPSLPTWYQYSVGNNPGNTHPEYYWQTAVYYYRLYVASGKANTTYRDEAYHYLGILMHLLEDASAPPHAYNVMHGAAYLPDPRSQDTIEYLSQVVALQVATYGSPFFGQYPYDYYLRPNSTFYPGKNVLDVGSHRDGDYQEVWLRSGITYWSHVLDTNLQAPAARRVRVDTYNPEGWPVFYLRFSYYAWRNGVRQYVTHESGEMCAANTCKPPRVHEWTDTFVANTPMKIEYKRPETGSLVFDRLVQFKVYVLETEDVRNEIRDPGFTNPWEYIDWLGDWTVNQATSAPFWRRYWRMDGDYGDLRFDLLWETAPNSERALLTMLAQVAKQTVKWALRAAFTQFKAIEKDIHSVSDQDAIGRYSYRVALYVDPKYNSDTHTGLGGGTPDYIRSYSVSCTPYPGRPCGDLYFTIDGRLVWLTDAISSVAVRNATVRLYKADNSYLDLTADAASLGSFDNAVTAVRITPAYPGSPSSNLIGGNLLLNPDADSGTGSVDGGIVEEIPGWQSAADEANRATVVQYGAPGFPDAVGPEKTLPNFFAGGPNRYRSALRQDVSVAALANMIDAGQVGYTIAGYFGGHADQDDWARLSATFAPSLMPDGHSASAGMVKAADRGDVTGLVYRSVSGFVPVGTRNIETLLDFVRACQTCDDYNHGYADTLSVVLQVRDNTSPVITPVDNIRAQPTGNVALDFHATDTEDGRVSVEVHSSNQAVIQDAWIVLSGDDGDPTHRVYSIVPERTGATRMGTGRTVMAITAYDSAGLRTDQYVVVDVLEDVYLPAIMK